jgi:hypothetical protein
MNRENIKATVRNVAVENVPCGIAGCGSGKPAVHVLLKSLPIAPLGTPLCRGHSPFDIEDVTDDETLTITNKLMEEYSETEAVRVTYIYDGEFYFFDGQISVGPGKCDPTPGRELIGYVLEWDTDIVQNVYADDSVETLASLHENELS